MAKLGSIDVSEIKDFEQKLRTLHDSDKFNRFCQACAKELAARLLTKAVKRTPVGQYPKGSGKVGGTLRRGWTAGKNQDVTAFVAGLQVTQDGENYQIVVTNPVEYAPYVEYGHRTKNHKGWVEGRFMMTISVQEVQKIAPKVVEKKLEKFLREALGNG